MTNLHFSHYMIVSENPEETRRLPAFFFQLTGQLGQRTIVIEALAGSRGAFIPL